MDDERLTHIHWFPVNEHGQEIALPEDQYLVGGGVRNVPTVGDTVDLNGTAWTVVRRLWTVPVPLAGAMTPRQTCTLHIRPE